MRSRSSSPRTSTKQPGSRSCRSPRVRSGSRRSSTSPRPTAAPTTSVRCQDPSAGSGSVPAPSARRSTVTCWRTARSRRRRRIEVTALAREVGYVSPAQFSQEYRQMFGRTPSSERAAARA
ncbi:MAG: helix-turn-helix transcriptional regulator [Actinobacteria bacterium]|nr:MAG: helix-turn-helix transcriptional regulator [Actinomycetota bacterium]